MAILGITDPHTYTTRRTVSPVSNYVCTTVRSARQVKVARGSEGRAAQPLYPPPAYRETAHGSSAVLAPPIGNVYHSANRDYFSRRGSRTRVCTHRASENKVARAVTRATSENDRAALFWRGRAPRYTPSACPTILLNMYFRMRTHARIPRRCISC